VEAEPYRPVLYRFAMLLASLAAVLSLFALVRRWLVPSASPPACSSCSPPPECLSRSPCPASPGPSCSRRWSWRPVRSSLCCFLSVVRSPRASVYLVYLLALAVAAIMLGPGVWIGIAIGLNAGPRPVRDRSDETRGERMSHALVRPGCGTSSRARWSGSLVQPRLQFRATRSSTASTVDQSRRGGRRRREPKWSRPVLTKLTSRDGGCGRSLVIER
jgi:hypothetical protein